MPIYRNGWPVLSAQPPVNYVAPNGKRVNFANANAAYILGNFVTFLHHHVEPLDTKGSSYQGVYSWRTAGILGSSLPSYHNCAVAFDYNGHKHPFRLSFTGSNYNDGFTNEQEYRIRAEMARLDSIAGRQVLRWGQDFIPMRRDPMHWELAPGMTPSITAQVVNIFKSNQRAGTEEWTGGVLRKGQRNGEDIASLREHMRRVFSSYAGHLKSATYFDSELEQVMMEFQSRVGITADGIVGPLTLRQLAKSEYGSWVPKNR